MMTMTKCMLKELLAAVAAVLLMVACLWGVGRIGRNPVPGEDDADTEAYVLVKEGTVVPLWGYQQLKMVDCAWCHRTVNLNRHHVVPQAANPALRDVKENLIVLCRDCHFVLGHRCNWKQYNPDVLYICTHFTNCVKSSDTRYALTNGTEKADRTLEATNDVPESMRNALERILKDGN